ncbi:hypothetical protein H7200_02105 [Candidatus Saccharibacteria bacterium]|nr:hypothetical protein [Candidatus Saccharibacteria bacterium]
MPNSPNQLPSGKQYFLRVAAFELELDEKLAAFTDPATRSKLPGFLHLFSQKKFHLDVNDRDIDGHSFVETRFRGFGMQVSNHTRRKFGLEQDASMIEHQCGGGVIITVNMQLGMQAAKELMTPPFYSVEEKENRIVPLYYCVPDAISPEKRPEALIQLQDFLLEAHNGPIDELMLVERAVKFRSFRTRQRHAGPKENELAEDGPSALSEAENNETIQQL